MAGTSGSSRPFAFAWRLFRRRDDASSTMASFIVGAAFFLISTTYLIHFIVRPQSATSGIEATTLKSKGFGALDVLLGGPGYPSAWEGQPATVDSLKRLGLLTPGSTMRVDAFKFDALARGSYLNPSSANGYVDYDEAKTALGLGGYDFHLRVAPVFPAFADGTYGITGMTDYHVGYLGHWTGGVVESQESQKERASLASLSPSIKYDNLVRTSVGGPGDAYKDDSASLKSILVPLLGTQPAQTVLSIGSGTPKDDFYIVNASVYSSTFNVLTQPTLSRALALSDGSDHLGYTKGREIRATLGSANMSGLGTADLSWKEWVDTHTLGGGPDEDDYGFVEVSPDAGVTWYPLTNSEALRSQDTTSHPQPDGVWVPRSVTINAANCAACLNVNEVQVALHWVADSSTPSGKGWIVDDMALAPTPTTAFSKNFERPEFDILIIGSDVDQNAFTPAEVKYGIRDYVNIYGGRILVLGGQQNTNWLEPLFHVGIRSASPGVAVPDTTHPLLTTPNELDWQNYNTNNMEWSFNGGTDGDLFNLVVGAPDGGHILSASKAGAFGSTGQDGVVMLSTYLPFGMQSDQSLRFFANSLMYGRYHYLFLDYGPSVPSNTQVASVTRTAIMDKTKSADVDFIEMGFSIYVWPGGAATGSTAPKAAPSTPTAVAVTPGNHSVQLAWAAPLSGGSAPITAYHIYRSTSPALETHYATCTCSNFTWVDQNVVNGTTYYYNFTAENSYGQGSSSGESSATPAGVPTSPQGLSAQGIASAVQLSWTQPAVNGGTTVSGYNIYRNQTGSSSVFTLLASIGGNLSFQDLNVALTVPYSYQLVAVNSAGESPHTLTQTATPLSLPGAPTLAATGAYREIDLTWAPTTQGGSPITSYKVYAGSSTNSIAYLATVTGTSYQHTGKNDSETWYYRVSAVNAGGEGAQSAIASGTTILYPSTPLNVQVTNVTSGRTNLTITWTVPGDTGGAAITGYTVWGGSSSGSEVNLSFVSNATFQFLDTNRPDNATRYYKVSASNAAGQGPLSGEVSGRTWGVSDPPALLTGSPAVGGSAAQLTIVPPANTRGDAILYYRVYRTENSDLFGTGLLSPHNGETIAAAGTGSIGGLNTGQTYKFQVSVVTTVGESALSNSVVVIPT